MPYSRAIPENPDQTLNSRKNSSLFHMDEPMSSWYSWETTIDIFHEYYGDIEHIGMK